MTALIRHPPAQMSSIASHVYPDYSQNPHIRQPLSQIQNPQPASSTPSDYQFVQNSAPGTRRTDTNASRAINTYEASQLQHQQSLEQQRQDYHSSIPYQQITTNSYVAQNPRKELQQSHSTSENGHSHRRPRSPIEEVSPKNVEFNQEPDMYQPGSTEEIASYLQIPSAIDPGKGSLSLLAARITCLFWFESSATLLRVEESHSTAIQALVPEAIPTMGFQKWVTTILSTTQVSQNVVLLALMYIYRLKRMNSAVKGKPGSEFRLFTVALMLGNKFLDDNTYTNKTWAEVSGITVKEIHVMEVEFLSNMRYTLYATKEQWTRWYKQLGKFARYFEQAARVAEEMRQREAAAQVHLVHPMTPAALTPTAGYVTPVQMPGTPTTRVPHPLAAPLYPNSVPSLPAPRAADIDFRPNPRKRSYDDTAEDRPSKRLSRTFGPNTMYSDNISPVPSLGASSLGSASTPYSDLRTPPTHLPLPIPNNSTQGMLPQLPVAYPQVHHIPQPRAMASVYSSTVATTHDQLKPQPQLPMPLGLRIPPLMEPSMPISATGSRNNSPLASVVTPTGELLSPMIYGNYRSSPYKPVRSVNSLLAPPPSTTFFNPANNLEPSDLQYRPIGKQPVQSRMGPVPHITQAYSQNSWPTQMQRGY